MKIMVREKLPDGFKGGRELPDFWRGRTRKQSMGDSMWGMRHSFLSVWMCVLFLGWADPGLGVGVPVLTNPPNGAIIQLPAGVDELTLAWTRIGDASSYILSINGPEGFVDPGDIQVEQAQSSPILYPLSGFVTGSYGWTVKSVAGNQIASSTPSFFTIQAGSSGGGNLAAPALLIPAEYAQLEGNSAVITFQWTHIQGATQYLFDLQGGPFFPLGGITIEQEKVSYRVVITAFKPTFFKWNVVPIDSDNRQGDKSVTREFLVSPVTGADYPFDLSQNWYSNTSPYDLNGDEIVDCQDIFPLLEFLEKSSFTLIPDINPPQPLNPLGGMISPVNVVFAWKPVPGALGYEFLLNDVDNGSQILHVVPQPSSGNVSTEIGFLNPSNYGWKVRAYFGGEGVYTTFSGTTQFQVLPLKDNH